MGAIRDTMDVMESVELLLVDEVMPVHLHSIYYLEPMSESGARQPSPSSPIMSVLGSLPSISTTLSKSVTAATMPSSCSTMGSSQDVSCP